MEPNWNQNVWNVQVVQGNCSENENSLKIVLVISGTITYGTKQAVWQNLNLMEQKILIFSY